MSKISGKKSKESKTVLNPNNFEALLTDLSASFINVGSEFLDANISAALNRIVNFLGVDRGTVGQFGLDQKSMNVTHSYAVKGIDPITPSISQQHVPYLVQQILEGKPFVVNRVDDLPAVAATDKEFGQTMGVKSAAAVPLAAGGITLGLVSFATLRAEREWSPLAVQRLQLLGEIFANALLRRKKDNELTIACAEVEKLKNRADAENYIWREQAVSQYSNEIIGKSGSLKGVMDQVLQVAQTDSTVLLLGETGTGKELIATAIHQHSQRKDKPLIRINCTSLTQTLIESELFGHEKGAFTGALNTRLGRFEIADSGTIVLDEIGELPLDVQSKLLRVLQFKEFERVGSTKTRRTNVRIIASTNRNLGEMSLKGTFRQDLYYRLSVFPITIPSLRQRKEDIPLLVAYFVEQLRSRLGKKITHIPERVIDELIAYDWPGNIRELENIIERSMIISPNSTLVLSNNNSLPTQPVGQSKLTRTMVSSLDDVLRKHIIDVCKLCDWKIEGVGNTADLLGINPNTLRSRMKKLGISRERQ